MKNLVLLRNRDASVRTERIVAFDVAPAGARYKAPDQVLAFYRELYSRLSQAGGVESVGMTSHLPMYDYGTNGEFQIEGATPWGANDAPLVDLTDAGNTALGRAGGRRHNVSGTFFHAIARSV